MDLKFRLDAHLPASAHLPTHEIVDHRATPTAPVCLCLPAMGASASYYRPFAQALARALAGTVVLADLRGQGKARSARAAGRASAIARSSSRMYPHCSTRSPHASGMDPCS